VRVRALRPASFFLTAAILLAAVPQARAAHPVPPVPGKQGAPGPREGFSTTRVRIPAVPSVTEGVRAPLAGNAVREILAIRVAFSDTPIESTTAYYDRLLFFLNQFWSQSTDGLVTLNSTLVDSVFTLPQSMAYYGDDDRFQERLVFLIRDVVAAADSTVDFRNKDLIVFHAGQGQEADVFDNSRQQLWSAFITRDDFKAILPDPSGAVGILTNDEISPGVFYRITEATELPEAESQDGFTFGMMGVLCHEYGHQLGLPDLYDTTESEGGNNQGLGAWDIMSGGVWNFNGFVPAKPSAWSRLFLGVVAPVRAFSDGSFQLSRLDQPVSPHPRAVQIPQTQSEYLLLENRDQDPNRNGVFDFDDQNGNGLFDFYVDSYAGAEFDFYLPGEGTGSGITIYHVDEAKIAATLASNTVNGDTQRKGVDLVEADGVEDLDAPPTSLNAGSAGDVFRGGYRDRLTPDTVPSSAAYGNVRTGISVTGITAADSVMSFDVSIERTRPGFPKILSGRVFGNATVAADIDGDGTIELLVPVQRLNNTGALYVFREDGTDYLDGDATPTPFITTPATRIASSPCVGDIDGIPGNEIVFQTANGAIYAFHADGTELLDGDGNAGTVGVLVGGGGIPTRAQPILADLDRLPGLEIVVGSSAGPLGGSILTAVKASGGVVVRHVLPIAGSSDAAPVAADVDGDGFAEVLVVHTAVPGGEDLSVNGLSLANWDIFTDTSLPRDPSNSNLFVIRYDGPYGAPVFADLDRDGRPELLLADRNGAFHALRILLTTHIPGDPPSLYVGTEEISGWPASIAGGGRSVEISIGDLEHDGYPEVFQMGEASRVAAFHWNGAPRAGFPVGAGDPLAPADTAGVYPPLIADVDGDGYLDVIAIFPDGRRLAYRRDGSRIGSFAELGSTGLSAPPILADLDGDGSAEWIETFDQSTQCAVVVREAGFAVRPGSVAWNQWRLSPTRNAAAVNGPAATPLGTRNLSEVYAYPNPARGGATTIHDRLQSPADAVRIQIFDPAGSLIAEPPVDAADRAGSAEHAVVWNHAAMSSGIYICRVEVASAAGTEVVLTRLAVLR
jgi:M6 family metalloprotease-like protein